jgi:hypothetical protein
MPGPAALSPTAAGVVTPKAPAVMVAGQPRSGDASPRAADGRGALDGVVAAETSSGTDTPALPLSPLESLASLSPPSGLTVEQYASSCVELAVDASKTGDVLRRYRLTPEARAVWIAYDKAYAESKKWFSATRGT